MAKYGNIAVIYGGDSSEWEVSCRSGEFTASHIDDTLYNVYEIFARHGRWWLVSFKRINSMKVTFPEEARPEVSKNTFSVEIHGEKVQFDYAYIMQHGAPGETGQLQGYFEMLGIPFSSCSAFTSTVTFDKYSCKSFLRDVDFVHLAKDAFIRKGENVKEFCKGVKLSLPLFVKPTSGGSSFGITKVKSMEELPDAIEFAFKESPTVIIEEGIQGREFTCAAYFDGDEVKTLPVIEIISQNEYFDYDAKYNGHSQEVCPAQIPVELSSKIQQTTGKIYRHLGCSGLVRIDYIVDEDKIYFLEVNTIPGMTNASLVPKMVRAAGIDITDFLTTIIENS